ncbi:MAG: DUF3320 domain-containing protein [Gammaproteobacteria bacterium]|nr:DUF3320 domain-containing protein [Gammaproteobacteria bacterium]
MLVSRATSADGTVSESISDPQPEFLIRAELAPRITFATHQCDVAVLANLEVTNQSGRDLEALLLHITTEPPVLGARTWHIDKLVAGAEFRPRDRRVPLEGGLLDALTERMRADVRIELRQGTAVLAESHQTIEALARNEWGGAQFMPELLAAFVTPNDPAVARVLKRASGLLQKAGKQSALEGYQSKDRKRVWEIAGAIWAAIVGQRITYTEPPASFEKQGQKIRLPSMIEEQGLATCLDTALLFASAFEEIGLYPIVAFTESHALTGVWLQPKSLPSLTVDDAMEVRKAIAQDDLIIFEATLATNDQPVAFKKAIAEGARQLDEAHESRFIYAIDIRQARGRGIRPLPAIADKDKGLVGVGSEAVEVLPEEPPDLPLFDVVAPADDEPQTPAERLERWKRGLLDLSKRNRLLNLKNSESSIPIFCPDPALLEDKIADGVRIHLIPPPPKINAQGEPDTTLYHLRTGDDYSKNFAIEALARDEIVADIDPKSLEKRAIEIYRKAKADFEEGGSNTLFLALGMLRWSPVGDKKNSYRAPLILLPVKLVRSSAASKPYLTSHDDEPVFNHTLLQLLRQDFNIELGGLGDALPKDEHGIHVRLIWDMVRAKVRDVPAFEVVEDVVLSTFSFAKYLMWKDLSERTETLKTSPFVRHILDTPREAYKEGAQFLTPRDVDYAIDPAELMAPLNADSSQIVAIHASGRGGDFVLEGPPGTGKSETIANIIAHNLGLGRRVLFVSEKMAALDVVYRRLKACGLGDFCLELHSAKANKTAVVAQLDAAWKKRGGDSAQAWAQKARDLKEVRNKLNGLVSALHAPGPAGISPHEAIGRSARYGDVHRVRLDWQPDSAGLGRAPDAASLARLEDAAKLLGMHYSQLEPEDVAAFGAISNADWSFSWTSELEKAAGDLGVAITELTAAREALCRIVGLPTIGFSEPEFSALGEIGEVAHQCGGVRLDFGFGPDGRAAIEALESAARKLAAFRAEAVSVADQYPITRMSLAATREWLGERLISEAKPWPLRILARRKLRKRIWMSTQIPPKQVPAPEKDLEALVSLCEKHESLVQLSESMPPGIPWHGVEGDPEQAQQWVSAARRLRHAANTLATFGGPVTTIHEALIRWFGETTESDAHWAQAESTARKLCAALDVYRSALTRFCAVSSMADTGANPARSILEIGDSVKAIRARTKRLNLWCAWVAASRDARDLGLGALVEALESETIRHDETVAAFRTAYACWVAPILVDARPELTKFQAIVHEDLIQTFRNLDSQLASLAAAYIRARLSASIPGANTGGDHPGYAVLSHEVQKKASKKPIRQLVSEMGAALTTLTPCLLMSPLSVAQFLPADLHAFDLIVFDEASQITVPDAIGAIARGRRCIVVGDPRQMPPTRFFERGADDDENEDAKDLESILDEALAARVPHYRLTGHYRSRHESLICFSNHAYYQGSLVTYPSAVTTESAVSLRRVHGVYAKGKARTNEIEAKALVAEVVRRLKDPLLSKLSIGVVTLNSEQQRLVEDLLDQERRASRDLEKFFAADGKTPVFVKNLETVQGDERDVILLSIGYGPTEPGAKTMSMNFGPLNRQGGERRLNVAITRATTEVIVFASFDASMIDLTRTSAEAVKDLKLYLDYAARGPIALGEAIRHIGSEGEYDSDFEKAVADRLRSLGWTVHTQIGVSKFRIDLGVVHPDSPGKFLAGIECDGATYHSSACARDRDRVRHIILEQLGWRLIRVWSTDYFIDSDTAIARIDQALKGISERDRAVVQDAGAEEPETTTADEPEAMGPGEVPSNADTERVHAEYSIRHSRYSDDDREPVVRESTDVPARKEAFASFHPSNGAEDAPDKVDRMQEDGSEADSVADPGAPYAEEAPRFHDEAYRPKLRQMAITLIDAEGPISFKCLSDRIARAHGYRRTKSRISQSVWAACSKVRHYEATPDGHKVFWPKGVPASPLYKFRGLKINREHREWRDVPFPEKADLVREQIALGTEDVARAVGIVIGYGRVTASFREEIRQIAEHLGHTGLIDR